MERGQEESKGSQTLHPDNREYPSQKLIMYWITKKTVTSTKQNYYKYSCQSIVRLKTF